MLDTSKINEIVRKIAIENLSTLGIEAVQSEPSVDSQGDDALRIKIIVNSDEHISDSGAAIAETLLQIHESLLGQGEKRLPIVDYVVKGEIESLDDPES